MKRDTIIIEDKAREKMDLQILRDLDMIFEFVGWAHDSLETVVKKYAADRELKLGVVAGALRAALTGRTISPPIFDVLVLLGKEQSIRRIQDVI